MNEMSSDDIVRLATTLHEIVRDKPSDVAWLTARARRLLRDARVDEEAVYGAVCASTLLVERPDGTVDHLGRLLDGCVFTQRVRGPLDGRRDLWATAALQPLLNLFVDGPLLADGGGEVRRSPFGQEALVGPDGWLPVADPYTLVGVRLLGGALRCEPVDPDTLPSLPDQQRVAELIAAHYRRERWWTGQDDVGALPGELVHAITLAKLEDPRLFSTPLPPLDELLHDPLEQAADRHHWRDFAATRQLGSVSFRLTGVPQSLHAELDGRAQRYGMALDQYVIAVLGHLAWRTPFAEDMEPWEGWWPDDGDPGTTTASA